MKRSIVVLYAGPALLVIGASLIIMEPSRVVVCGLPACAATVVVASTLVGFARSKRQRLWPVVAGILAGLTVIVSVMMTHWPLRTAYLLARPSLDRLAQEVRDGSPLTVPARVGLFTIKQAEVSRHGIVCLWVDLDPAGKTGFVQCGPDRVLFNLWTIVYLDDHWQFISED